jgi:hypothetical protein
LSNPLGSKSGKRLNKIRMSRVQFFLGLGRKGSQAATAAAAVAIVMLDTLIGPGRHFLVGQGANRDTVPSVPPPGGSGRDRVAT